MAYLLTTIAATKLVSTMSARSRSVVRFKSDACPMPAQLTKMSSGPTVSSSGY